MDLSSAKLCFSLVAGGGTHCGTKGLPGSSAEGGLKGAVGAMMNVLLLLLLLLLSVKTLPLCSYIAMINTPIQVEFSKLYYLNCLPCSSYSPFYARALSHIDHNSRHIRCSSRSSPRILVV